MSEESILELVKQLVSQFIPHELHQVFHKRKKKLTKQLLLQKWKKFAFKALLFPRSTIDPVAIPENFTEVDWYLAVVFDLRNKRKFDDANHLEDLLQQLEDSGALEDDGVIATLKLLLILTNCNEKTTTSVDLQEKHLPLLSADKMKKFIFPEGPLFYGDTCWLKSDNIFYMHYPKEIFEQPLQDLISPEATSYGTFDPKVFEMLPCKEWNTTSIVETKKSKDDYLQDISSKLYGALSHRLDDPWDLDVRLEIPELGGTPPSLPLKCPSLPRPPSKLQVSDDEGFTETDTPTSASSQTFGSNVDIWETVLTMEPKKYYTWESVGNFVVPKEKPYLTEAGPETIENLKLMQHQELHIQDPKAVLPPLRKMTMLDLVRDSCYVMLGIPSTVYLYDSDNHCFNVNEGVYIEGISSDCISLLLQEFAECGMHFVRIHQFDKELVESKMKRDAGTIFEAFIEGLQLYLQFYHASILLMEAKDTAFQLLISSQKIRYQIRDLYDLYIRPWSAAKIMFPTGIQLLTFLYSRALEAVGSDFYPVALALFHASSIPYFRFLQRWIYEGVCQDKYEEFQIVINSEYLMRRDHQYWSKAFTVFIPEGNLPPLFLSELFQQIYICGKSVNLLKLCCPKHHLCTVNQAVPSLLLTFSEQELQRREVQCQEYVQRMEQLAIEKKLTREQQQYEAKQSKLQLMQQQRKQATRTMKRIQETMLEKKQKQEDKKRMHLAELKQQIQDARERQAAEKEKLAAEEKAWLAQIEEMNRKMELKSTPSSRTEASDEISPSESFISNDSYLQHDDKYSKSRSVSESKSSVSDDIIRMEESPDSPLSPPALMLTRSDSLNSKITCTTSEDMASSHIESLNSPVSEATVDSNENEVPLIENVALMRQKTDTCFPSSETTDNLRDDNHNRTLDRNNANIETNNVDNTNANIKNDEYDSELASGNSNSNSNDYERQSAGLDSYRPTGAKRKRNREDVMKSSGSQRNPGLKLKVVIDIDNNDSIEIESENTVNRQHDMKMRSRSAQKQKLNQPSYQRTISNASEETDPLEMDMSTSDVFTMSKSMTLSSLSTEPFSRMNSISTTGSRSPESGITPSPVGSLVEHTTYAVLRSRGRNVHGHASDSTVQTLLYGDSSGKIEEIKTIKKPMKYVNQQIDETLFQMVFEAQPYSVEIDKTNDSHLIDITSSIEKKSESEEVQAISLHTFVPLPVIIQRSLESALQAQTKLVNSNLVNYFLVELQLEKHLETLRSYLFLHNGEFGQSLSELLFDKITAGIGPAEILNPVTLNSILTKAVSTSRLEDNPFVEQLSFLVQNLPQIFFQDDAASLDCLQLQYKIDWPLNIIITNNCLIKYNKVFSFLMQIKYAMWALSDIFYHLKRNVHYHNAGNSPQFSQLQLFRHEMQHYIRVMQAYISSQVLQMSWDELKQDLANNVHNLDDLYNVHMKYLNRACFRCLLHKKAAPVMNMIKSIFSIILKFRSQMLSSTWEKNPATGKVEHSSYWTLCASYKSFQTKSGFLYKAWLHEAVGVLSGEEIGHPRIPATLARLVTEAQLQ